MSRRAFTLLEVMAVVVILGLLATATMFSLAGDVQAARRSDVIDLLAHEDHLARLAARRTGRPAMLRFDLDAQRFGRIDQVAGEDRAGHSLRLPKSSRIAQVLRPGAGGVATVESGLAEVSFSQAGVSETYALRLNASERPGDAGESTWIVFAGMTGQKMLMQHEDEVRKLLELLGAPRPDAR